MDSSDFTFPADDSHLLSEPSIFPSSSNTGPDLSISELYPPNRPFSLLAPPDSIPSTPARGGEDDIDDAESTEDLEKNKRLATKLREEKLQSDIFILKKLNAAFASFHNALDDTGSSNERIAGQLEQTDALLNKYIKILSKSEDISRLIFDEKWLGADDDEGTLEREREENEAKAIREAEERAIAAQRELERNQREEKEKAEREAKERMERERKERIAMRGGVRGVRGTRASMRGTRSTQGGSTAGRPSTSSTTVTRTSSGKRPSHLRNSSLSTSGSLDTRGS